MLMGAHARREADEYISNPRDSPPQNPLMRIFNMADRDRDMAKLRIDLALGERTDVGLDTSITWDEYLNSVIGVLDGRSAAVAADVAFAFSENFSATAYLSHEQIESSQANAEALAQSPLWSADNRDTTDTAGAGIKYRASDKLELGVEYTYARSTGEIDMSGSVVAFPDLTTRLNSARLYVDFTPREKLALRLSYWYEDYRSDDWSFDDVAPSTISNVLAFGQGSPSYHINVFTLSGRYKF
jgi:opacity protein-like surface antigen